MNALAYTATLPAKRMAAGAIFLDDADRLLLVEPNYKDDWEIPGGVVEANESPLTACLREVEEELGLTCGHLRLLAIDWVPPTSSQTEGLMIIFEGGRLTQQDIDGISLPTNELRGFAFCTFEEAACKVSPRMAHRLAAALAASQCGTTVYLEDGIPRP